MLRNIMMFIAIVVFSVWNFAAAGVPESGREDGDFNAVMEITESGSPITSYTSASLGSAEVETLFWGDRVLWTGNSLLQDDIEWREIFLGDGSIAWIQVFPNAVNLVNAFYTTPGVRIGEQIRVLPDGSGANLRTEPSTYVGRVRQTSTGDVMTVVDGPYQAEFHMWWLVQYPNGDSGWLIDIAEWYEVESIGRG